VKRKPKPKKRQAKPRAASHSDEPEIDVAQLLAAIHEDEEYSAAEEHILNKAAQLPRILLCFHFAAKHCDTPYLSSGHVEQLTDGLGKRIKNSNIATVMGKNRKYFTADKVRRQGALVRSKINRPGEQAVALLLQGEKLK